MALLNILEHPDPRLRIQSEPVTEFSGELGQLVDDLLETMYASKAIGLSAPQANDHREVLVMDTSGNASAPKVFINPEILSSTSPCLVEEGCVSLPGILANVVRSSQIRVRARDRSGETFECDLIEMEAVCLQHEMDHLVGKLFIDRLSWFQRLKIRRAQKRLENS